MMEEVAEVDLCLVCCSKIKSKTDHHLDNNNSQLLSSNLNVFYLLRRVLQVPGIELKKNLISCGNPGDWIRLCDKCDELTRQAEELYRKLRRIERKLSCIEKLIWEKARSSINSEDDRKLVEETIDSTRATGQVWRRIRNHVANKRLTKYGGAGAETIINPYAEGDKLANYLITQKSSTAILPVEHCEENENEEDDCLNVLEETNSEATSSPIIKIEVTPELDLEGPQLPHHQNYENRLIDNLLVELREVKVEFDDKVGRGGVQEEDDNLEEMEVDDSGGDKVLDQQQLNNDKVEEEDADWNWEPDDDDEVDDDDNEESEDDKEEFSSCSEGVEEDLEEKGPGKSSSGSSSTTELTKDKQVKPKMKDKLRGPSSQKRRSTYIKKGTAKKLIRTEDGKIKCRHCDQIFSSASGLNSHEREKHPKTPGAFICDICGGAFNSRDYLRVHKQRSHKFNPDGTLVAESVKIPKMRRTQDGKYQCLQCDQIYASSKGCRTHQREKHSQTPGAFICDVCGRAFNSHQFLSRHKACSHKVKADGTPIPPKPKPAPKHEKDDEMHMCEQCGKGLSTTRLLKKHVRFVHEKRFDIKCTLCGAGWPSTNALKKHLLAMHSEDHLTKKLIEEEGLGIWICPVIGCSVRFLKESSVKGHLKSKHGKEEEAVEELDLGAGVVLEDPSIKATCSTCGKICVNKAVLKKHEEVHENEGKAKEYVCEICGDGFARREYLKGHVDRVHLKKRRPERKKEFKCELCGKGYTSRRELGDHLEIHKKEGRRDYFCDKCAHGFTTENYLRKHKKRTNCGEEGKQARVYNRKGE